ncbi:DUF3616 domain-containing protein [Bosea sp. OAE506]|uniref:DUF3616 domain-containing protein n=1 Tax=Bosea sp. OAE506 TaxID=2663870 RepID=UPI00178AE6D3
MLGATVLIGLCVALAPAPSTQAAEPPAIRPSAGPLEVGEGFAFASKPKKTRQSLSGIACPSLPAGAPRLCLAVFDEGGEARYLTLDGGALRTQGERIVLRPGKVELDAEAAATDGRFYYVAGSHSAKRSDCETNPESRRLMRFGLDPKTGRADLDSSGRPKEMADTNALWTLMGSLPGLKEHVGDGMCLGTIPPGRNGVNIEGLAVKGERLFVGYRGPVTRDGAKVLSVDKKALFEGGPADPKLFTLPLGPGRSVRDLVAVSDGILILTGPDDDKANEGRGFAVLHWTGADETIRPLASLDLGGVTLRGCDEEIKPEAIAVLSDEPGRPYEALILSDGLCDGGALRFGIPR